MSSDSDLTDNDLVEVVIDSASQTYAARTPANASGGGAAMGATTEPMTPPPAPTTTPIVVIGNNDTSETEETGRKRRRIPKELDETRSGNEGTMFRPMIDLCDSSSEEEEEDDNGSSEEDDYNNPPSLTFEGTALWRQMQSMVFQNRPHVIEQTISNMRLALIKQAIRQGSTNALQTAKMLESHNDRFSPSELRVLKAEMGVLDNLAFAGEVINELAEHGHLTAIIRLLDSGRFKHLTKEELSEAATLAAQNRHDTIVDILMTAGGEVRLDPQDTEKCSRAEATAARVKKRRRRIWVPGPEFTCVKDDDELE